MPSFTYLITGAVMQFILSELKDCIQTTRSMYVVPVVLPWRYCLFWHALVLPSKSCEHSIYHCCIYVSFRFASFLFMSAFARCVCSSDTSYLLKIPINPMGCRTDHFLHQIHHRSWRGQPQVSVMSTPRSILQSLHPLSR